MKRILCLTFFLSILFSCENAEKKNAPDKLVSIFTKTVDSVFTKDQHSSLAYIILPNSGCGGCISSAEQLLLTYARKKIPVKFILTNVASLKAVRNTFGDSIILGPNVFIDKTGLFYSKLPELDKIYPILFYVDSQGIPSMYKYVNPDHPNAIQQFEHFIDSSISKF